MYAVKQIKRYVLPLVLVANTGLSETLTVRDTDWQQSIDKDEITVFEGEILADGAVPLKGSVIINHSLAKVATVMADTKGRINWLPSIGKIKILKENSKYSKVEYYLVEMPMFVSNRTAVLETEITVVPGGEEVVVKVFSSKLYPEDSDKTGYIRAKVYSSEVRLKSIQGGEATLVTGVFYTDPSGLLPNWIITRFTREYVYKSLVKLRNIVDRNKYKNEEVRKYADLIQNYHRNNRMISSHAKKN